MPISLWLDLVWFRLFTFGLVWLDLVRNILISSGYVRLE